MEEDILRWRRSTIPSDLTKDQSQIVVPASSHRCSYKTIRSGIQVWILEHDSTELRVIDELP